MTPIRGAAGSPEDGRDALSAQIAVLVLLGAHMNLGIRLAAVLTLLAGVMGLGATYAPSAAAEAPLPYVAFGVGLSSRQTVEAVLDGASVARTTTDASGRWKLVIEPGPVKNGDVLGFSVDGVLSERTAVFQSGRFTPPPGLALGAGSASSTATPTPRATATPKPAVTPRATSTPAPRCTKNGRPIACSTAKAAPVR